MRIVADFSDMLGHAALPGACAANRSHTQLSQRRTARCASAAACKIEEAADALLASL